ncbi:hypothetical protein D3C87_1759080 [compost metagenome]
MTGSMGNSIKPVRYEPLLSNTIPNTIGPMIAPKRVTEKALPKIRAYANLPNRRAIR